MARNIGSVEITVVADTGRLQAQLVRDGVKIGKATAEAIEEELDRLQAEIELQTAEPRNAARLLRRQIEATLEGIDVGLDLTEARALLRTFEAEAEQVEIGLNAQLSERSIADMNARLRAFREGAETDALNLRIEGDVLALNERLNTLRREQERDAVNIDLNPDIAGANARIGIWRDEQEANALNLRIEGDVTLLNLRLAALRRAHERDAVNIELNPQIAAVNARLLLWRQQQQANALNIPVNVNQGNLAGIRAALAAHFFKTGTAASGGFRGGFTHAFADDSQVILGAVVAFGDSVAIALEGVLGGITAIASSAVSAVGGAAGAALGAITIVGFVAGASVVGLEGFGDAIGVINDEFQQAQDAQFGTELGAALGNLAPNAALAALAFLGLKTQLRESRLEIQQHLFAGVDEDLRSLGGKGGTIENVTDALVIAADKANIFVGNLTEIVKDTDFKALMEGLGPAMDSFFRAGEDAVGVIEPFILAITPGTLIIAAALESAAQSMADWVAENPDELRTFFSEGAGSLLLWTGLLSSVSGLLTTIFQAGRAPGNTLLEDLTNIVLKWDEFLEGPEGQRSLADFFDDAQGVFEDITPALEGLRKAWEILTEEGAADNFAASMDALGTIFPIIAEALSALGDLHLVSAIADVLSTIEPLVLVFNELPEPIKQVVGQMIIWSKVINNVSTALTGLKVATGPLFLLSAAIGAAFVGFDLFTQGARDAKEEQEELDQATARFADRLQAATESLLATGEGASAAGDGYAVFNEALSQDEDIDATTKAIGRLGLTQDDLAETMIGLSGDTDTTIRALEELGVSAGLPRDAAHDLAIAVEENADGFETYRAGAEGATEVNEEALSSVLDLSERYGLMPAQIGDVASAMAQLTNETRQQDFSESIRQQLQLAQGLGDVEIAALNAAIAQQVYRDNIARGVPEVDAAAERQRGFTGDVSAFLDTTEDLVPVWQAYQRELVAGTAEAEATEATRLHVLALSDVRQESLAAGEASDLYQASLQAEHLEAFRAALAQENLARQTRATAIAAAEVDFGLPGAAAEGFIELGESFRETAERADSLSSALDILFGGFPNFQEATSNAEEALDAVREQLSGLEEDSEGAMVAVEGWAPTLNLQEEAGRANAAAIRDSAAAIQDYAIAATQAGVPTEEITATTALMREELEGSVAGLIAQQAELEGTAISTEEANRRAETYVSTLLGAPGALETVISTPGLLDALLNSDELTLTYDRLGNPVITEFQNQGFDLSEQQVEDLLALLESLGVPVNVIIDADTATQAQQDIAEVQGAAAVLGGTIVSPTVDTTSTDAAQTAVEETAEAYDVLSSATATPEVEITDAQEAEAILGGIKTGVEELDEAEADPTLTLSTQAAMVVLLALTQKLVDDLDKSTADPEMKLTTFSDVKSDLDTLQEEVDTLDDMSADPNITLFAYSTIKLLIDTLQDEITTLDAMVADPAVSIPAYAAVKDQLDTLQREVAALDLMVASISITLPGIFDRINEIDRLGQEIEALRSRTIFISVVRSGGSVGIGPGAMAGELITSPGLRMVGEHGLAEAIIPLQLPLNRVSPDVRELAALIRGEGMTPNPNGTIGKQIIVNQAITPLLADPVAVATQTVNRIASVIN